MSEPYRGKFVQDGKTETFYAWRVTRDSVEDVAIWCGGRADSLHYKDADIPFVNVYDTANRPETAKTGDWVVKFSNKPYYRVLDDPVFQTMVHVLGATLVEESRETLAKPEQLSLNIVYDTPRVNNSVVYTEPELSLNIFYENGRWVNYRNGVKTVFGVIYSETVNAHNLFKTNNEGES